MSHTPGPWRASEDTANILHDREGDRPQLIGSAHYVNDPCLTYKSREETYANARLMAAAPELLSALQEVLEYFTWAESDSPEQQAYDRALEVIAKATQPVNAGT